jgi:hypothetical protein
MKGQGIGWEGIFTKHISKKGLATTKYVKNF